MKKILTILAITIAYNAYAQDYIGNSFTAKVKMKSPVYYIGNPVTDTAAGMDWVREYHTSHTSPPNTYTAGFGLGLNGFQFYNSRYWKGQDSLSTTLTGLILSTAGKLTAITDNSTSWNTAYGWGNHAGLYKGVADSVNLHGFFTNFKALSYKQKGDSVANSGYASVWDLNHIYHTSLVGKTSDTLHVSQSQKNAWNAKQSAITPQSVSAGSNKITLGGTYTGAALQAFSVDVNQSNIDHNSLLNYSSYRHFKKVDIDSVKNTLTGLLKSTAGLLAVATPSADIDHNGLLNYKSWRHFKKTGIDSLSASIPYSNAFSKFVMTDTITGKLYRTKLTFGSGITRSASNGVTNDLITGKIGGQTVLGGSDVGDYLTYKSTTGVGTSGGLAHIFKGGANGSVSILSLYNSGTISTGYNISAFSFYATGSAGVQANFIKSYSSNVDLSISTYTAGKNILLNTTGNVAIGSVTPMNKLHMDNGNATAAYLQGTCGSTTGQLVTDGWWIGHDASGNVEFNQKENLTLSLSTRNNNRLHILANGNVGIDTVTPAYKLDVNGSINLTAGNAYKIGGVDISIHDSLRINTTPKGSASMNGLRKDGAQRITLDTANASYGGAFSQYQYNYLHGLNLLTGSTNEDNTTLGVGTHSVGQWNTCIGNGAGEDNVSSDYEVLIGNSCGGKITTGDKNTAVGYHALGENTTGSGNVCIGYEAGGYLTKSNKFCVNNSVRWTEAGDTTKSLIYGGFNTNEKLQYLKVNGGLSLAMDTVAGDQTSKSVVGVNMLKCLSSAIMELHGFSGGREGQLLTIVNPTIYTLTLAHNSTGLQKIMISTEADYGIPKYGAVTLACDGTNWYLIKP